MQEATGAKTARALLTRLVGRSCSYCADGTLAREQYKGNDAVVCSECETPTMQLF